MRHPNRHQLCILLLEPKHTRTDACETYEKSRDMAGFANHVLSRQEVLVDRSKVSKSTEGLERLHLNLLLTIKYKY